MKIAHDEITEAVAAALGALGYPAAHVHLMATEPPRPWGVTCNACFALGKQAAAAEIEAASEGKTKNEIKALSAEISRRAVTELAQQAADAIDPASLPYVGVVEAEAGYLNFYYDQPRLAALVVATANAEGDSYGGAGQGRIKSLASP